MNKTDGRHTAPEGSLRAALQRRPAVRRGQGKVHPRDGMLALAVCARWCGGGRLYAISQWGRECEPEIRVALGRRAARGPRVATRQRAFGRLDQAACARVLGQWCAAHGRAPDEALAMDGQTLRGLPGEAIPGGHLVAAAAQPPRRVLAAAATVGNGHALAGVQAVLAARPARRGGGPAGS
jgi:DDE_Tnp_1-associated